MRRVIGAIIIENNKILLVRKKETWIFPGGKPEPGESELECLCREVGEELSGTELDEISHYRDFAGVAPHKGDSVQVKTYFAKIKGELKQPSAEISAVEWVSNEREYTLSDPTSKAINRLRKDGYL